MKSLGLAALFVIGASLCSSYDGVYAIDPAGRNLLIAQSAETATPPARLIAQAPEETAPAETAPAAPAQPAPSSDAPHISTPVGDVDVNRFPGLRDFLEDQQNAHDKLIVDRFLLGVAVMFAVIAAALMFSLPPKQREPREQKE